MWGIRVGNLRVGRIQIAVVVHIVHVGVLRVSGEVVGDLVIPCTTRGGLEGRAELREKERCEDHPAQPTENALSEHAHARILAHCALMYAIDPPLRSLHPPDPRQPRIRMLPLAWPAAAVSPSRKNSFHRIT